MGTLIQALIGFLGAGMGQRIGRGVANAAALAALAPVGIWLLEHKEDAAITLSYGTLALIGALMFCVVKLVHYTRAPERPPWGGE